MRVKLFQSKPLQCATSLKRKKRRERLLNFSSNLMRRERDRQRVHLVNFLASSYNSASIRRYEKRQRDIIVIDWLCWPEEVLTMLEG